MYNVVDRASQYLHEIIKQIETIEDQGFVSIEEQDAKSLIFNTMYGAYALNINEQEIWYSSPVSTPQRFHFDGKDWRSNNKIDILATLLTKEFQQIHKGLVIK